MWLTGMKASQLLFSSVEVIYHRSVMIGKVMTGSLPFTHPEFTRMWHEKMVAGFLSSTIAGKHLSKNYAPNMLNKPLSASTALSDNLKMLSACMQPYAVKAKANAKRLR